MKTPDTLIVHPSNDEQVTVLKAFLEALKIKFEISTDAPYNPDFVAKILKGKEDIKKGKGVTYSVEELNELCK